MQNILKIQGRPEASLIAALAQYGTAMIADAMGRFGALAPSIRPLRPGTRIAGPAVTVQTYRSDNLMLHVALEMAERGDILVASTGEVENAGLWGDLMTHMALRKGLGGLVTDGAVRDSAQLRASGFGVYSKSVCPMGGFKQSIGSVNHTISCGGAPVAPGDIIIGDDDGVVVVPRLRAQEVLSSCKKIERKEEAAIRAMEEGKSLFEVLGLTGVLEALDLHLPPKEGDGT